MFNGKKSRASIIVGGFTIVELIVVIAIIGILSVIITVTYKGIAKKAVVVSVNSDLDNAAGQLESFRLANGKYPLTINCGVADSETNLCIKASSGNSFSDYTVNNATSPKTYGLSSVNSSQAVSYRKTKTTSSVDCPAGFIVVPGSPTYNTRDFCVMKYEAKQVSTTNVPISRAGSTPWVNISQTNAINYSPNVSGCDKCHLITEAEWMTIAQNVLLVPSNWSTGVVGSGFIYSGHDDNDPGVALAADASDSNSYAGTNNVANSNQRRTLTLSNGEVIWDLSGNVHEWTSGRITGGQPGIAGESTFSWKSWKSVNYQGYLTVNISPYNASPEVATWSDPWGLGELYSNSGDDSVTRAFIRGGTWWYNGQSGIFTVYAATTPSNSGADLGFRVAASN